MLHKSRRNHPWQLRRALTLLCVYVVKRRDWRETVHFLGSGFSAHVIQMVTRKHLVAPEIGLQLKKPGIYWLIGVHRVPVQMHEIRDVAVSRTGGVPAVCFMLLHCRWTAGQFWSSLCILLKQAAVGSPLPSSSRFCRRHQSRMSKVCLDRQEMEPGRVSPTHGMKILSQALGNLSGEEEDADPCGRLRASR